MGYNNKSRHEPSTCLNEYEESVSLTWGQYYPLRLICFTKRRDVSFGSDDQQYANTAKSYMSG